MYKTIIIGAGASGLMCANQLSDDNFLVLEKTSKALTKLQLTGGGRCNLTNLKPNDKFIKNIHHNPKSLYSTLKTFGPQAIYDYFNSHGVPLKVEAEDRVFPQSDKAADIAIALLTKISHKIKYNQVVIDIKPVDGYYEVSTPTTTYQAENVVVSTGGASFIKTGSSGDHLLFAKKLDIKTVDLFPAETSILLTEVPPLSGISFEEVKIKVNKKIFSGNLIFTHFGLSGHGIMNASDTIYLNQVKKITIDFLPKLSEQDINSLFDKHKDKTILNVLSLLVYKRFGEYLLTKYELENTKVKQAPQKKLRALLACLKAYEFNVSGVQPIENAYVCGGGISTKALNLQSFEVKTYPGLYFIGESVDLHGPIGGYNLTIAFSSGYSCAMHINQK